MTSGWDAGPALWPLAPFKCLPDYCLGARKSGNGFTQPPLQPESRQCLRLHHCDKCPRRRGGPGIYYAGQGGCVTCNLGAGGWGVRCAGCSGYKVEDLGCTRCWCWWQSWVWSSAPGASPGGRTLFPHQACLAAWAEALFLAGKSLAWFCHLLTTQRAPDLL